MSVYDSSIDRGMALLDEKVPGWEHRVDLKTLDVSSCTACVVGQLFAGFNDERVDTGLYAGYETLGVESPRHYGFSLDWERDDRVTYGGLTTAWKRKIRARRSETRRPTPGAVAVGEGD